MDSYDKLKPYGIAINGCIDGFSRHAMFSLLTRKKVVINLTANYTLAFSFQPPLVLRWAAFYYDFFLINNDFFPH